MNPLRRLRYAVTYRTGLIARTDLQAGGLFFCVVYRDCLRFRRDGKVRRWCEVIAADRPFHDEIERLTAERAIGQFGVNERGYLRCEFPDREMTGLPCERKPWLLTFHIWNRSTGVTHGEVYGRRRRRKP